MKLCVAACLAAITLASTGAGRDAAAATPDKWIDALAADGFSERRTAEQKLEDWAQQHADEARERFFLESAKNPEPEVRKRCRELLRGVVLAKFRSEGEGYVGIQMGQLDVPLEGGKFFGVRVSVVVKDTPAEKAGLKAGDVIMQLDGKRWDQPGAADAFKEHVMARKPGDVVEMQVMRRDVEKPVELKVKLARRPTIPNTFLLLQQRPGVRINGFPDVHELQRREEEEYFDKWYQQKLQELRKNDP